MDSGEVEPPILAENPRRTISRGPRGMRQPGSRFRHRGGDGEQRDESEMLLAILFQTR